MSVIPEVKCRRCGESFSALRSRCPNCGTRRVAQSGRTPAATPGTVKGTAAYERAETNTKWQMIFGLILVVAVILAVIVMVVSRPDGLDSGSTTSEGKTPTPTNIEPTDGEGGTIILESPTPRPATPTPAPDSVKVFYYEKELDEFTEPVGTELTLKAVAYPIETFSEANFKWSISDESIVSLKVSDDTKSCTVKILQTKPGGVILTVECNGVKKEVKVYTKAN
jgi:DNA-directed RNA polymerase subunit RPC12/RpoP